MTMPSQRRMFDTAAFGLTVRNIGTITVGPVTTVIAPNRKAICQERSRVNRVARAVMTQVLSMPMETMLRTTFCRPRISLNLSVRLPSKRMIATESEIKGKEEVTEQRLRIEDAEDRTREDAGEQQKDDSR